MIRIPDEARFLRQQKSERFQWARGKIVRCGFERCGMLVFSPDSYAAQKS